MIPMIVTLALGTEGEEWPVMDMVIFRTIFFELFSFLHDHAPYPPFRLLMNLVSRTGIFHVLFTFILLH